MMQGESDLESPAERERQGNRSRKRHRKNAHPRCRRCGKHYSLEPWKALHRRPEVDVNTNDSRPRV
jgi:transposase-like protein